MSDPSHQWNTYLTPGREVVKYTPVCKVYQDVSGRIVKVANPEELLQLTPPAKLTTRNITKMDHVFTPTPPSQDYESDSDLYTALVEFLMSHVELPAPAYYSICALFALATWRVEHATVATYLNLLAPHGSGKSTLQGLMRWLCARSIHSAGATKGAIVRIVDGTNATLMLDETDAWLQQKDWDNPIMAILNAGYQRGICALMCEPDSKKQYKVVAKDVFGFKIISGRNPLVDPLASRCITISMRKTSRTFPKLDLSVASQLRGQLRHYGETHTDPLESEVVNRIEEPRLREIMQPLFACAPTETVKEDLLQFAWEEQQRRQESEVASVEAEIARAVIQLGQGLGELSVRAVTNAFNELRTLKEQWKNVAVSRILQRLGFHTKHTRSGSVIQLKPDLIDYLIARYGKDAEPTPATEQSKLTGA